MKSFLALICTVGFFVVGGGAVEAHAQVEPSAYARTFTIRAGGFGSYFQPDYGPNRLIGPGAFVDVTFTHWMQVEAEGRWLRFHQYADIYEDNYLIGPRVPVFRWRKTQFYAKALVGDGKMNFQYNYAQGNFTDIAFGGGADYRLGKRLTLRAADFEYQMWPKWVSGTLSPYGVSAGVSYRVFGGR
jgi:hypothetical protein